MRRIHVLFPRVLHHHRELVIRILHHRCNDSRHKWRWIRRQIHNDQGTLHCVIRPKVVFANTSHAKHIVGADFLRAIQFEMLRGNVIDRYLLMDE